MITFTQQESEFLIKGLLNTVNKQEAKISAIQDEMQGESVELLEGVLLLDAEETCKRKIAFVLEIIKKIENLTINE